MNQYIRGLHIETIETTIIQDALQLIIQYYIRSVNKNLNQVNVLLDKPKYIV